MIPVSIRAVLIAASCAFALAEQTAPAAEAPAGAIPNFAADTSTSWQLDQTVDDLLPPPSGAGPITFDPAHPYIANFRGAQPTYRVADIDTIGISDKTFVDNYRTPHTSKLHVVERLKLVEGGKTVQISMTVDDPGAFTAPWSATQRWRRVTRGPITEEPCNENNTDHFNHSLIPTPTAAKPDF
jgi:hypothetical protein